MISPTIHPNVNAWVPVFGPRFPHRWRGRDGRDHGIPCRDVVECEVGLHVGQPGAMRQRPLHRDVRLAVRRELGPELGDRRIRIEPTLLDELIRADGYGAFGTRGHEDERVAFPHALGRIDLGHTAPEVDNRFTVDVHGARGTDLALLCEVGRECLRDALEGGIHRSVDIDHRVALLGVATALSARHCTPPHSARCRSRDIPERWGGRPGASLVGTAGTVDSRASPLSEITATSRPSRDPCPWRRQNSNGRGLASSP